jgi:hypothetical protein
MTASSGCILAKNTTFLHKSSTLFWGRGVDFARNAGVSPLHDESLVLEFHGKFIGAIPQLKETTAACLTPDRVR